MFEISSKKVDFEKSNTLIKKNINLDENLDCFILISSSDNNFGDLILNNILDLVIDKVSKKNTYNDFSIALENINAFVKTWKQDSDKELKLDIVIGFLSDNNYIFSNIGKTSCYLINSKNEIIELTNKEDNKKEFNFISSGKLGDNDIVVSSTKRLLNYLSKSDLLDGLLLSEDIKIFNKNIKNILLSEILEENVAVSSLKYISNTIEVTESKIDILKENLLHGLDNKFSKKIIAYFLHIKDKLNEQSKIVKNVLFLSGITISVILLYSVLSTVVGITTQSEEKELAKNEIIQIKTYLRIASENIANPDNFELNIINAEKLILKVKEKQIFLNDLTKINDDINILKKQFNKIEIFEETEQNIIYKNDIEKPVKIIKKELKPFIINEKGITGPILPNQKAKNYIFNSLSENEIFVDATFIGSTIYLITNNSKVVEFSKNSHFRYVDVISQKVWEKTKEISSYGKNIYLLGDENNQIYKHSKYGNNFKAGEGYLTKDDLSQIGEILSITIDGGFYILKKDLSIIKFYSNPYRLEKISINKLPKNYDIENQSSPIDLKTRSDLNYLYLLLNNKIWVFQPNTKNYKNTKSLTYIGQIESEREEIKDFFINHDGEIIILNKKGLYKVNFEISDERLIVR